MITFPYKLDLFGGGGDGMYGVRVGILFPYPSFMSNVMLFYPGHSLPKLGAHEGSRRKQPTYAGRRGSRDNIKSHSQTTDDYGNNLPLTPAGQECIQSYNYNTFQICKQQFLYSN